MADAASGNARILGETRPKRLKKEPTRLAIRCGSRGPGSAAGHAAAPMLVEGLRRRSRNASARRLELGDDACCREIHPSPRHIEVQVFGDSRATSSICSARLLAPARSHQKVIGTRRARMVRHAGEAVSARPAGGHSVNYEGRGDDRIHRRFVPGAEGARIWSWK